MDPYMTSKIEIRVIRKTDGRGFGRGGFGVYYQLAVLRPLKPHCMVKNMHSIYTNFDVYFWTQN